MKLVVRLIDVNFNFNLFIIIIYIYYMVVIVLFFEQGYFIGFLDRVFFFNNIQIFADGKMFSDFEDEFNSFFSFNLLDVLIFKVGSIIIV